MRAVRLGFDSVMFDAAHLPFEENIKATKHAVGLCHYFGIPVEAELGKIPDADEEVDWQSYYTDVAEAERFVRETGVDWLAISAGIVHGVCRRPPRSRSTSSGSSDISDATGIPLVLHGASGVPDDEIRAPPPSRRGASSTPTPTCGTRSAPASRRRGPRATGSWRRRWTRADPDDRRHRGEAGAVRLRRQGGQGALVVRLIPGPIEPS